MPRNLIRSPLLILCIALLAAASVAVACSGDDDPPEPPAPPAAAEQPADADVDDQAAAEPEQRAVAQAQAEEQAAEQAAEQTEQVAEEDPAEEQAAQQAEEQAEEQAVEQAEDQAVEQAEDQAEDQAAEQAEEEGAAAQAAEQAEEQAAEQAEEPAVEEPTAEEAEEEVSQQAEEPAVAAPAEEEEEEDTPDAAAEEEAADEIKDEPLISGPLGDFAPVDDFRFRAVITLDIEPNASGGDTEILTAFEDITIEGAYLASGDHEIAISLGDSAFLPPMGIVSIGDTLYTNLGFGWESAQGSTGALVDGLAGDLLGIGGLVGGLDLQGLIAGGDLGILLTLLPYETWEDGGAETLDSGSARIYSTRHDDLAGFFESFAGALLGGIAGGIAGGALPDNGAAPAGDAVAIPPELLAALGELESVEIRLWIDEATGIVARLDLAIDGLLLRGFGGPGADLSIGALSIVFDTSPEFGLLTSLVLDLQGLDIPGPEGMSGGFGITLEVTDVNSGDVVIEPPI